MLINFILCVTLLNIHYGFLIKLSSWIFEFDQCYFKHIFALCVFLQDGEESLKKKKPDEEAEPAPEEAKA